MRRQKQKEKEIIILLVQAERRTPRHIPQLIPTEREGNKYNKLGVDCECRCEQKKKINGKPNAINMF